MVISMFIRCLLSVFSLYIVYVESACPQEAVVSEMCIPSVRTGSRVLIDMSTATVEFPDCKCTFTTTANTIRLMTDSAPNYSNCGTAVDINMTSGASANFECLSSGTFFDTTDYKNGTISLSQTAPPFDKNYCVILEHVGKPSDTVTVRCLGLAASNSTSTPSDTPTQGLSDTTTAAPLKETTTNPSQLNANESIFTVPDPPTNIIQDSSSNPDPISRDIVQSVDGDEANPMFTAPELPQKASVTRMNADVQEDISIPEKVSNDKILMDANQTIQSTIKPSPSVSDMTSNKELLLSKSTTSDLGDTNTTFSATQLPTDTDKSTNIITEKPIMHDAMSAIFLPPELPANYDRSLPVAEPKTSENNLLSALTKDSVMPNSTSTEKVTGAVLFPGNSHEGQQKHYQSIDLVNNRESTDVRQNLSEDSVNSLPVHANEDTTEVQTSNLAGNHVSSESKETVSVTPVQTRNASQVLQTEKNLNGTFIDTNQKVIPSSAVSVNENSSVYLINDQSIKNDEPENSLVNANNNENLTLGEISNSIPDSAERTGLATNANETSNSGTTNYSETGISVENNKKENSWNAPENRSESNFVNRTEAFVNTKDNSVAETSENNKTDSVQHVANFMNANVSSYMSPNKSDITSEIKTIKTDSSLISAPIIRSEFSLTGKNASQNSIKELSSHNDFLTALKGILPVIAQNLNKTRTNLASETNAKVKVVSNQSDRTLETSSHSSSNSRKGLSSESINNDPVDGILNTVSTDSSKLSSDKIERPFTSVSTVAAASSDSNNLINKTFELSPSTSLPTRPVTQTDITTNLIQTISTTAATAVDRSDASSVDIRTVRLHEEQPQEPRVMSAVISETTSSATTRTVLSTSTESQSSSLSQTSSFKQELITEPTHKPNETTTLSISDNQSHRNTNVSVIVSTTARITTSTSDLVTESAINNNDAPVTRTSPLHQSTVHAKPTVKSLPTIDTIESSKSILPSELPMNLTNKTTDPDAFVPIVIPGLVTEPETTGDLSTNMIPTENNGGVNPIQTAVEDLPFKIVSLLKLLTVQKALGSMIGSALNGSSVEITTLVDTRIDNATQQLANQSQDTGEIAIVGNRDPENTAFETKAVSEQSAGGLISDTNVLVNNNTSVKSMDGYLPKTNVPAEIPEIADSGNKANRTRQLDIRENITEPIDSFARTIPMEMVEAVTKDTQTTKKTYSVIAESVPDKEPEGNVVTKQVDATTLENPELFGIDRKALIIVLAVIGGGVLLLVFMACVVNRRRKKRTASAPITRNGFTIDNIVYDGYSEDPEKGMSPPTSSTQRPIDYQQPSTSKDVEL